jgi:hypothetical protein
MVSSEASWSHFDALSSNQHNDEAQLYAFDILALEGDDLRELPLGDRKTKLAKLLACRPEGIFVASEVGWGMDLRHLRRRLMILGPLPIGSTLGPCPTGPTLDAFLTGEAGLFKPPLRLKNDS